ncbi:MAG TPA: PhoPQ-activated pathogenicity-like protein PqaA type, partial [Pseudothermotoga sp.]|nr:PhoPQ-activated pathogenicity-like protein PqaA type [Pseudothermotoga sp.]
NASSFFKLALSDKLPEFAFELEGDTILIKESEFIKEVYLHRAISDTTDFRKSLWLRLPVLPSNGCYSINVEPPEFRHVAYYAEVVFEIEELRVSFCTPALYK